MLVPPLILRGHAYPTRFRHRHDYPAWAEKGPVIMILAWTLMSAIPVAAIVFFGYVAIGQINRPIGLAQAVWALPRLQHRLALSHVAAVFQLVAQLFHCGCVVATARWPPPYLQRK